MKINAAKRVVFCALISLMIAESAMAQSASSREEFDQCVPHPVDPKDASKGYTACSFNPKIIDNENHPLPPLPQHGCFCGGPTAGQCKGDAWPRGADHACCTPENKLICYNMTSKSLTEEFAQILNNVAAIPKCPTKYPILVEIAGQPKCVKEIVDPER